MLMLQRCILHSSTAINPPLGVQSPFHLENLRAIAVHRVQSYGRSTQIENWSGRLSGGSAGRMCEVGPPASARSFFTVPYSRRRRSTGILPCGAGGYCRKWGTP